MLLRARTFGLFAAVAAAFAIPGVASEESALGLEQLRVSYTYGESLYVITGTGREALRVPARRSQHEDWKGQGKLEYGFSAPDTHPQQDRIIAVRYHEYDPSELPHRGYCDLVEIPLQGDRRGAVRVLYEPPDRESAELDAPAWSPDGRRIAFLVGSKRNRHGDIAILDVGSQTISKRIPLPNIRGIGPRGGYLHWSRDSLRLLIWITRAKKDEETTIEFDHDVGIVSLETKQVKWLGEWRQANTPEEIEAVQVLLGPGEEGDDVRTRVLCWSPDRHYFFYTNQRMGMPAKEWVERYDVLMRTRTAIKTVWWSPFAE